MVPFPLLSYHWGSEGVSLSESMRRSWDSGALCLTLLVFTTTAYWDIFTQHWNPGLGEEPGVELGPLTPQGGPPQPEYPFQFLTAPACRCGTSPLHISAPPTSLHVAASFYP